MTNISLLEMRKTKKRNVREAIISVLGRKFPLNMKKIYNEINKEYKLGVTYQAVFKLIKEMTEENILEKSDREYKLNINWIKQLENELDIIKKIYSEEKQETNSVQSRINEFVAKLGPKIRKYIGKDNACIVGISGGGKLFAMSLLKYLLREGLNARYVEIDWLSQKHGNKILAMEDVKNRKVILVDSEVYSGTTYRVIMEKLNKVRTKLKIKEIKFVADRDLAGLADFARFRN